VDENDTGRLEAFSDGVFAVAITLLVLNIKVPDGAMNSDPELNGKLLTQLPALIAYITSFATIGVMWLNHHRLFKHIECTDTPLMFMNLLLLLVIVFIPVPTGLLAQYLTSFNHHTAAIIYGCTCFLMACCFNLLWRYASYNNRLLSKDVDPLSVKAINQQYIFGPILYLISIGLAFINSPAMIVFSFALAVFFALPARPLRMMPAKEEIG